MFKGFRDFILRGNVVDLAVAFIIGAAFGAITSSLTADVITPLISSLFGTPDFQNLIVHIPVLHHVTAAAGCDAAGVHNCPGDIRIGKLLNAGINFILVASAIYFGIVLPMQYLLKKFQPAKDEPPSTKPCPQCLSDIPIAAARCKFCTQPVTPAATA
jgi:large conductance mechanosensitive channel